MGSDLQDEDEHAMNQLRASVESLNIRNGELTRQLEAIRSKNTELEIANRTLRDEKGALFNQNTNQSIKIGELEQAKRSLTRDVEFLMGAKIKTYESDSFAKLRFANVKRNIEWDRNADVGAFWRASEMAGEAGEMGEALLTCLNVMIAVGKANNTVKKLERERLGIRGSRTDISALGRELADVVITTDLAAMHYGIDLWGWTRDTFNATSDKQGLITHLE